MLGIGYYYVGVDLEKNRSIVLLGIIGKSGYFLCCTIFWLLGDMVVLIFILGVIDLVFATLFLEFWVSSKKKTT